ncbi:transposase [Thalassomonas viridans]|uniref:Transposase n=1 Tax=Thalassomonas viridans TaxID=137584 RepID=A0AAE9Z9S8_9GAMM|nr:transposase [Thalassomonas viridans]
MPGRLPHCTHRYQDNRKAQIKFTCIECGFTENADAVGAMNIFSMGTAC